jgi:hypothetical protein
MGRGGRDLGKDLLVSLFLLVEEKIYLQVKMK